MKVLVNVDHRDKFFNISNAVADYQIQNNLNVQKIEIISVVDEYSSIELEGAENAVVLESEVEALLSVIKGITGENNV